MRIVVIVEYYPPHIGGLERLFQKVCEGLVSEGHSVDLITCALPGTDKNETVKGVNIHRVGVPRSGDRYWFTLLAIPASLKYARKADVILTTTYNGAFPAWIASRFKSVPAAIFVHEVLGKYWSRIGLGAVSARIFRTLENMVLSLPFDAFITNSDSTMKALTEWGGKTERMKRIYPGIDYELFNPEKYAPKRDEYREKLGVGKDFTYIFFGRPGYVKGVWNLVRAVPLIKESLPDARCVLILSKKPTEGYRKVETLIKELNLEEGRDITILDPVDEAELPSYLSATDAVVVPSLSEGFGFTCVEACTMERPVVASNVASLPEVVSGRYNLVEPGSPEAIARGVIDIACGNYRETPLKRFSWDDTVKSHIEVFEKIIAERRA